MRNEVGNPQAGKKNLTKAGSRIFFCCLGKVDVEIVQNSSVACSRSRFYVEESHEQI